MASFSSCLPKLWMRRAGDERGNVVGRWKVPRHVATLLPRARISRANFPPRHTQQRRRPLSSSSGALSLSMAAKQRRDVRPAATPAAPSTSFTGAADPGNCPEDDFLAVSVV
ncbi:unnamed protein product [Lampetra fluviatilis]